MAQNYVGSNNINLLSPCGQFGTRLMGGKDAASPRYVFTKLEPITRCIYHPHDDPLLAYLDDDGQSIEPTCYVPVIPMVLVNGSDGIGTGWSSTVPTYNPREIIANLRAMLQGEEPSDLVPWFRGFTGEVAAKTPSSFSASGILEADFEEGVLVISELPVGKWTTDYKQFLESMMIGADKEKDKADKKVDKKKKEADEEGGAGEKDKEKPPSQIIKDFKENHTDTTVLFTINVPADKLADAAREKGGLEKKFKMDASIATSNMHMFDLHGMIRKYESPLDIMRAFYNVRVDFYGKRKDHLSSKLTEEWEKLDNKVRFIVAVCEGKLKVSNRKKDDLLQDLRAMGYKAFVDKKGKKGPADDEAKDDDEAEAEAEGVDSNNNLDKGYDYLLSMKIWSLTMERVQALTAQRNEKRAELDALLAKTPESLWLEDLDALELALDDFEAELEEAKRLESKARKAAGVARSKKMAGKPKAARKAKKAHGSDSNDDDDEDDDASDFSEDEKPVKKAPTKPKAVPPPKPAAAAAKPKPAPAAAAKKAPSPPKPPAQPDRPLTLAERLALIKAGGPLAPAPAPAPAPAAAAAPAPAPMVKAAPAKKAPVAAAKPKAKPKAKAPIDLCDTDDDEDAMGQPSSDEEEEAFAQKPAAAAAAAARAPRQAAKKPVVYSVDSDEEEDEGGDSGDEDEEDEEEFDDSEDDESDFDNDEDSDDSRPKGKGKGKGAVAKAAPVKKAAPAAKKAPAAATAKSAGVKRPVKSAAPKAQAPLQDMFSPGEPQVTKKAKRSPQPAKAAAKPKAVAKPKAAAKPKKRVVDSDDEEEAEFDDEPVVRTPKPSRARKTANYANYFDGSDDEEDEEEEEEDEEEFSD
jgi:DNA topoisomerase-2